MKTRAKPNHKHNTMSDRRILVIPDVHEELDFLTKIENQKDFSQLERIILLGDYFDPKSIATESSLAGIAENIANLCKSEHGKKVTLLLGNHDLPYYYMHYANTNLKGGIQLPHLEGFWQSYIKNTYTPRRLEIIEQYWDNDLWERIQIFTTCGDWLFSHAGINVCDWANPSDAGNLDALEKQYAEELKKVKETQLTDFIKRKISFIRSGKARQGEADFGGPLWKDWHSEFKDDLENYTQIVGHTHHDLFRFPDTPSHNSSPEIIKLFLDEHLCNGKSYCIDGGQLLYTLCDPDNTQRIFPRFAI